MAGAKIVDFDYFSFLQLLRRSTDAGTRIDPSEGAKWATYIRSHKINEIAATAIARGKFPSAVPVIIADGSPADGLYFYSSTDEGALRLVPL